MKISNIIIITADVLIKLGMLVVFVWFYMAMTRWIIYWYPEMPLIFRLLYIVGSIGILFKVCVLVCNGNERKKKHIKRKKEKK